MNDDRVIGLLAAFAIIVIIAEGWARNLRDFIIASVGGTPSDTTQGSYSSQVAPGQSVGNAAPGVAGTVGTQRAGTVANGGVGYNTY